MSLVLIHYNYYDNIIILQQNDYRAFNSSNINYNGRQYIEFNSNNNNEFNNPKEENHYYDLNLRRLEKQLDELDHLSKLQNTKIQTLKQILIDSNNNNNNNISSRSSTSSRTNDGEQILSTTTTTTATATDVSSITTTTIQEKKLQTRLRQIETDLILAQTKTNENTVTFSRQHRLSQKMKQLQQESYIQTELIESELYQLKLDMASILNMDKNNNNNNNNDNNSNVLDILKDEHGEYYLNPLMKKPYNDAITTNATTTTTTMTFCLPWTVNSDEWWTHHVEWFVSKETNDEYCFSPIKSVMKRNMLQRIYNIQFRGDCTQVHTKRMWSNGWGADISNIIDGLLYSAETKQPFQVSRHPWHYATTEMTKQKNGNSRNSSNTSTTTTSSPAPASTCPEKTMQCYFLPLSRCPPNENKMFKGAFYYEAQPRLKLYENQVYLEYITRPQTWLRKAVFDFSNTNIKNLTTPCTIFHVRRGDVVLHDVWARRYYAIEEYITATKEKVTNMTDTIFLITDDDNAIIEARTKFPQYNWVVIDRPRFKGKEGGWENHFPSNDPKLEVIILLSIFRTASQCKIFTHTRSNLADYIAAIMMMSSSSPKKGFIRIDMNEKNDDATMYNLRNAETYNISKSDWRRRRRR